MPAQAEREDAVHRGAAADGTEISIIRGKGSNGSSRSRRLSYFDLVDVNEALDFIDLAAFSMPLATCHPTQPDLEGIWQLSPPRVFANAKMMTALLRSPPLS